MDQISEIKAKISIEDLVSEYVQLKKSGRNLKGICPFHSDSRPSLMVNPDKGLVWCFVCQKGGDIFKFLEHVEKIDFYEALKILSEKAGVQLKTETQASIGSKKDKSSLEEVMLSCSTFYINEFAKDPQAQEYWKTRSIDEKITKEFLIGFAPNSFSKTLEHLKSLGFHSDFIEKAGISIRKDGSQNEYFDRFRNRVMIPIKDHLGKIVGFGGRVIQDSEKQAKYLNSPDTLLYNKSNILFGLFAAKEDIRKKDFVIILEGYMDVISSFQAGVKNVVAVSGTALTELQLNLLKRFTKNIVFCFDQDNAGTEATIRSIHTAAPLDFSIKVITFEVIQRVTPNYIDAL